MLSSPDLLQDLVELLGLCPYCLDSAQTCNVCEMRGVCRASPHLPPPTEGAFPSPWRKRNPCVSSQRKDQNPWEPFDSTEGIGTFAVPMAPQGDIAGPSARASCSDLSLSNKIIECLTMCWSLLNDKAEQNTLASLKQNI